MFAYRERLQLAEQRAEEEVKRREKAESEEYNLRFLLEQQTHKLEILRKKPALSVLEKKLESVQATVKRMKTKETQNLREYS